MGAMNLPIPCQRGFTLLEVLVALAVLAVALGALVKAAALGTHNIAELRDRTVAGWVAANKINEILLTTDWPELGDVRGATTMAGREWRWRVRVSNTPDSALRRLDVSVRGSNDDSIPLATVAAFKGRLQ